MGDLLEPLNWPIHFALSVPQVMRLLRSMHMAVVMCDVPEWRELLGGVTELATPPLVIVTSSHADDRLCAEALNLGAYDVLAKPFDPAEVRRTVSIAVLHWEWNLKPLLPLVRHARANV
jgi:DNA-binding NtrC family response regulator